MCVGGQAAGLRSEDDERFAQLYAGCHRSIRDYCRRRVAPEAVDDAVADTFLTVWRRLHEVPAGERALVWIYRVAFRVVGHQWRGTARRRRLQARLRAVDVRPLAAPDETAGDRERQRLVLAALDRLGDTDAEVLRLVAWEHLSIGEVAAVLGIKADAARQRLHRARRKLAREYERLQSHPTSPVAPTGGAR